MDRTESVVVQVAPDVENEKIQEMQRFGWNLQGRQEVSEQGDAYGRPSYLSAFTGTYVVKTKVKRYTKLHFVRSLELPGIERIRRIEAEYFSLPFPKPPSFIGPIVLGMYWVAGTFTSFGGFAAGEVGGALGLLAGSAGATAVCVFWVKKKLAKRQAAVETCRQSMTQARTLLASLEISTV